MWLSPFCFVIGVEFAVIFGVGKLHDKWNKAKLYFEHIRDILFTHPLFSFRAKNQQTKSTPIEKKRATPISSWQQEQRSLTDLPEAQQSLVHQYRDHWHQIRNRFSRKNRILDWYNFHLSSLQPQELITHLNNIFTDQSTVFKLNVSFGFILRNNETGALQYYYASRNNEQVFEEPFQINTAADL